jgi:hypothetical protein
VGRDLEEVCYAGKRIWGYGDFVVLKHPENAVDFRQYSITRPIYNAGGK